MASSRKRIEAPAGIVRHRQTGGTIRHNERIARFWKNKETGVTVQVGSWYIDVHGAPGEERIVNYFDPSVGRNLSLPYPKFVQRFEKIGNISDKF